jgi:hypothetical protein
MACAALAIAMQRIQEFTAKGSPTNWRSWEAITQVHKNMA